MSEDEDDDEDLTAARHLRSLKPSQTLDLQALQPCGILTYPEPRPRASDLMLDPDCAVSSVSIFNPT